MLDWEDIQEHKKRIFVFGSNRAGRHGKGAALYAKNNYGAQYGIGEGPTGNSYAIPTKDERLRTLPLKEIKVHVETFLEYARNHSQTDFELTAIGTGLAGYLPSDIAPMFVEAPENVVLPLEFIKENNKKDTDGQESTTIKQSP